MDNRSWKIKLDEQIVVSMIWNQSNISEDKYILYPFYDSMISDSRQDEENEGRKKQEPPPQNPNH